MASPLCSSSPPFIVCGDFNAHSILGRSRLSDARGRPFAGIIEETDSLVLSERLPTFLGGREYTSCLDILFCSLDLAQHLIWLGDVEPIDSNHTRILISHEFIAHIIRRKRLMN